MRRRPEWLPLLAVLLLALPQVALAQTGTLSPDDPALDGGYHYDTYPYQGTRGERLTLRITSSEIDPYLLVLDPDDHVVWEADDSDGQGLNVLETLTLDADGTYRIVVTSALAGQTGRYELSVQGAQAGADALATTTAPEANVVQGRVTDLQGDPVPNATVTIAGYTGAGANVVERAVTGADGTYRHPVPAGLYHVDAEAEVTFRGETYHLYLHPADGSCEELYSEGGVVKDFVLRLTGLQTCLNGPDPANYNSYSGGTVYLDYALPRSLSADALLTVVLTPTGPLLDGSEGETQTFTRPVAAADVGLVGPLERTMYLHDIPVGPYRVSGFATLPDGSRRALRFGPYLEDAPSETFEVGFEAVRMFPYGVRVTSVSVYDDAWAP